MEKELLEVNTRLLGNENRFMEQKNRDRRENTAVAIVIGYSGVDSEMFVSEAQKMYVWKCLYFTSTILKGIFAGYTIRWWRTIIQECILKNNTLESSTPKQ